MIRNDGTAFIAVLAAFAAIAPVCSAAATKAAKPATQIEITTADAPMIKQAIAGQRGRVVVVNMWATWCPDCVAEFPDVVKLQKRYRQDGLIVFAVSGDFPKDINTKVRPFLKKQGVDFPQFIEHADDPADFINAFDPKWYGDFPRTFIYDKQGNLAKVLAGKQTSKSFSAAVEPLLK